MKKIRYIKFSKREFSKTLDFCKLFSNSLEDANIIIKQFNSLTQNQRLEIIKAYSEREKLLKIQINSEDEDMYLTCTAVNFNIVATKYDIDPATVCICIASPCKSNEKIIVI
ncbi:hypothetical protein [Clostridium estertheticum]|uniref:Uncharacterized protein n=1 Tax=Clostridium estertheticum subsp. estertheticum TaxID=1552 RepID=A0A1J0GIT2_9CLOT|nr:hypothetical protein [Clostridium estertheticum]APC40830.1 hypothetical protein A7L45_12480 [Clostridium estertheticum subsp. estertheticum]MBZ9617320.1 hypothetical protein [Clostridium estertheticum subsp. laramiense]WAG73007.1 hypothetical protein LL032_17915 [Clostridium estertheticum]